MRHAYKFKNALKKSFTAPRLVLLCFLAAIFLGALVLMTPLASADGAPIPFLDALFTATSAVCVTGLTVKVTALSFSPFGHAVILFLVQIGGLGIMTVSSFIYFSFGKRSTLYNRITFSEDLQAKSGFSEYRRLVLSIVKIVFISELCGAVLLTAAFSRYFSFGTALWYGVFHSVTAFCNAGFDLIGANGFATFAGDPFVLIVISLLVILGGLGYIAILDIIKKRRYKNFGLNTKIVIPVTLVLLFAGMGLFLLAEWNNPATIGNMDVGTKILNAFFQAAASRTAGFATLEQTRLANPSVPLTMLLMFIGACPGSTGGGLKTTTLFVLLAAVIPTVRDKKDVVFDFRRFGEKTFKKAATILVLALTIISASYVALSFSDGAAIPSQKLLFELISAYGTAGLSMGVAPMLSALGKIVLMLNMFLGRVGVYTFIIAFLHRQNGVEPKIIYPEADIHF
jgi:trk system potassium uptake protein TrkH